MTLETMAKDERSQLLYIETRAVDQGGIVNEVHMNDGDRAIMARWNKSGFVKYGRILAEHLGDTRLGTHYVELSDDAWRLVAEERKQRAARTQRDIVKDSIAAKPERHRRSA